MFSGQPRPRAKAKRVVKELGDHALTLSHARHISLEKCRQIGLVVRSLEDDDKLQDAVLSVHHACIHTLAHTPAFKIIENHLGKALIQIAQPVVVRQQ